MLGLRSKPRAVEEKSTSLADLIAFHSGGAAQWSSRDPEALARIGYHRNVIAYRCVQMIADAAATVPLTLKEHGMVCHEHRICGLLKRPNPDQSGQAFLETIYGHLQISGNAYLEIVRGGDDIIALYPLRPDRITIETNASGWPNVYRYSVSGQSKRLRLDGDGGSEIIHLKLFNPLNDLYGQSPMQVAGRAIDLHNAAVEWNKSLLDNAARPSGALVYRGPDGAENLTSDQFDRLKRELSDAYQGFRNAGRPMVLDGGLDWKQMSLSPAEMDFHRLKDGAARDIALAFGVPPMLLGIPGDNTYSNYQQAVLAFWRQTVLPLVSRVAGGLTLALAEPAEEIGFDIDAIDALTESRTDRLKAILDAPFITDREKRVVLGFPEDVAEA